MRRVSKQTAILGVALLWIFCPVQAQQALTNTSPAIRSQEEAPQLRAYEQKPSGPEISIGEISLSGLSKLPISDRTQIVNSIKQEVRGTSLDSVIDEACERARAAWQDRGYFKVEIAADSRTLTSNPSAQTVALNLQVEEGVQYRLQGIYFKNNHAITGPKALRNLFPIKDGEIFSRKKIATGLENLRKAYGQFGFINFTTIPNTLFDDQNSLITVDMDFDEGRQFYVNEVKVLGLGEAARNKVLKILPFERGQIYNSKAWEWFLFKCTSMLPRCACRDNQSEQLNAESGVMNIVLDFRTCSSN